MTPSEAGKLGAIKSAQIKKHQKELRIQEYNKNPKLCKNCGKPIPYEKRKFSNCSIECGQQIKTKHNHIYVCPFCNKKIIGKNNILNHKKQEFSIHGFYLCEFCKNKFDSSTKLGAHITNCKLNPKFLSIKENRCKACKRLNNINSIAFTKRNGNPGYRFSKSGKYKGIFCESSWQLAFLVFYLEHNLYIERTNEYFTYISPIDNKEHKYHPDFKIGENTFVEIKGQMDDLSKIKIKEFIKNNPNLELKIISLKEIQPYLKYVKEKYGYKFYEILYE